MHIRKSVLFFAMLVGLQVPAFAEELPFDGKTVVTGQAPDETGFAKGSQGSQVGAGVAEGSQHPNPRTGGVPRVADEIRAEDIFGGSIVMADTKIPLSSNSFAALSTEKYDVSLPSRLREQSPRDYEFCSVLLNAVNGKEYEFDLRSAEISFDSTGVVAQALQELREDYVVAPLPSQADTGSGVDGEASSSTASGNGVGPNSLDGVGTDGTNTGGPDTDAESTNNDKASSSQDLRSKLRRSYRASLPFRESGTRVYISVTDLDKYLQDVGATVDSSLLSVRFMVANTKFGWDIEPERMKATIKDKLSKYERSDVGETPALPSVNSGEVASTFIRWDDLRRPTGLSPDEMRGALSGVLPQYADFIAYCERTYGVNAAFVNAVAQSECGAGVAGFGRSDSRCNLFSIRSSSGAYKDYTRDASSIDEAYRNSIEDFCILVSKMYLTPSGVYWGGSPTSYGVSKYYAESPTWANAIENARQEFYSKLN